MPFSLAPAGRAPTQLFEGLEDESPLMQPGMRDAKARLVDPLVPVQQEVEVERPRAAGKPLAAAPELALDAQEQLQERARRQGRLHRSRAVEEAGLINDRADGVGFAERRDGDDLDSRLGCEALDRCTERSLPVAE